MPLPFAPPPKDSSLYQQLESTTLDTLTADQLQTIKDKTFSQGTEGNEDEYRRLLLLGLAADKLSLCGPIPGTSVLKEVTHTGTGSLDLFTPTEGVWQLMTASKDGNASNNNIRLYWGDYSEASWFAVESGSVDAPFDILPPGPIYFDKNSKCVSNCQDVGGGTVTVYVSFIRVR